MAYKEVCAIEWLGVKSVFYDLIVEMTDYFDHLPGGMPPHLIPGPNLPTWSTEKKSSTCVVS